MEINKFEFVLLNEECTSVLMTDVPKDECWLDLCSPDGGCPNGDECGIDFSG